MLVNLVRLFFFVADHDVEDFEYEGALSDVCFSLYWLKRSEFGGRKDDLVSSVRAV